MGSQGRTANNKPSRYTHLYLQKLTDIHLRSHLDSELEENGDIKRIWIFSAIALFILLIACINYINLSTARSALRAKEIGIRKVSGARRNELVAQFLCESVLITGIALLIALTLTWMTLPLLAGLTGQTLSVQPLFRGAVLPALLLTPCLVGTLSGLYPALFLSSFQPVKTLKGLTNTGGGSISFRKILVVTQFAISIILIISTAVVFTQLRYMQNTSLGLDKEHILTLPYANGLDPAYETFRIELLQNSNILNASRSSRLPSTRLLDNRGAYTLSGDSLRPATADVKYLATDYDFISTYGIRMAAGRNFSREFATDSNAFVMNESAVATLGWKKPEDAIGQNMKYGNTVGKVIGVMRDFHFESLHQKIVPLVMVLPEHGQTLNAFHRISVKIAGSNIQAAIGHIEKTWRKFVPGIPFESNFLDEQFEDLYRSEQRQGSLFTLFAGIAILIAFPVAWLVMNNWLQDFAYRIHLAWWIFLAAGTMAALVALLTIGGQTIKAALSNPVKNLRSE